MFTKTVLDQVSHTSNAMGNQIRNAQINKDREQQRELQQQQQAQKGKAQAANKANDTGSAFRTHMSNAGPLEQQDEYHFLKVLTLLTMRLKLQMLLVILRAMQVI